MPVQTLTEDQNKAIDEIISSILTECKASAIAVCGLDGSILTEKTGVSSVQGFSLSNIAALAIGSFSTTKELANLIGETSFKSVFQRGRKSGILIHELNDEFIIIMLFGEKTTEGLARLFLKKVSPKIAAILEDADGQTIGSTGVDNKFEIERNDA